MGFIPLALSRCFAAFGLMPKAVPISFTVMPFISALSARKANHKYMAVKRDRRSAFHIALLDEGFDDFVWEQIDTANTPEELNQKEIYWINFYKSNDPQSGYNLQNGGIRAKHSKETRRKISEAKKGTQSHRKGKHHTEESRRKMSEHTRARDPDIRKKNSEAHLGQIPWNKGKSPSTETRRKLSEINKGKSLSKEHRRKLSEAGKQRWEKAKRRIIN
jgi:hypothetical protein